MKRFVYFYLMRDAPAAVGQVVPAHVAYWHGVGLPDYIGGPFTDRTGGLITFRAPDLDSAQRAVAGDPFVRERLIDRSWVKEWRVEPISTADRAADAREIPFPVQPTHS